MSDIMRHILADFLLASNHGNSKNGASERTETGEPRTLEQSALLRKMKKS
jgi:hypothetical protein